VNDLRLSACTVCVCVCVCVVGKECFDSITAKLKSAIEIILDVNQ